MKAFDEQMVDFDGRRLAARITDAELASRAGLQASTISHYRCGRREPGVTGWAKLNNALDSLIRERAVQLQKLSPSEAS